MGKPFLKILTVAIFVSTLASVVFARGPGISTDFYRNLPPPRLKYPITDQAVLTGKDFLEFQWGSNDLSGIDHYDFRLYKGYNTYADNLMLKKELSSDTGSIKIEAALFENNQVYTWTLRQIFLSGAKSDLSFNSFRVIKE